MIKIYYSDITNRKDIELSEVPKNVRDFLYNYKEKKSKKLSMYSWLFLMQILYKNYGIKLEEKKIIKNQYGKPYMDGIYFNISHSNNMIAIAISDKEVGIDIESESNLKKHLDSEYYLGWLNKEEIDEFNKTYNKLNYLTRVWTKKEAILKSKGKGINNYIELKNVEGNVSVYEIKDKKNEKYLISVTNSCYL